MSPLDLAVDAIALLLILYRQRRVRRVPLLLSGVGLAQFLRYNETHSLGVSSVMVVLGSCFIGAWALGALRAATVELYEVERGSMAQRSGWLTMVLWLVSVGVHFSLA